MSKVVIISLLEGIITVSYFKINNYYEFYGFFSCEYCKYDDQT